MTPGLHNVTVDYYGDDNYNSFTVKSNFTAGKYNPSIDVNTTDIVYGDNETVKVILNDDATGTVNITVTDKDGNSKTFNGVPVSGGSASVDVSNLTAGDYSVEVNYSGNDKYKAGSASGEFSVSKVEPSIELNTTDITYGDNETITVTVPDDATGYVNITVTDKDGNSQTFNNVSVSGGKATQVISLPASGEYTVAVVYSGDKNYNSTSANGGFTVAKVKPQMDLETANITYGDDETITVTLPGDAAGNVTISVNGTNYTETVKDGQAVFTIDSLDAGNYTVSAKYSGDDNYGTNETAGEFEVDKFTPTVTVYVVDIIYGDIEVINVTCDAPGYVDITVNGNTFTVSLDNGNEKHLFSAVLYAYSGKASLSLENLAVGTYPTTAVYNGSRNYNSADDDAVFHVIKANTTINTSDVSVMVDKDAVINVNIKDSDGKGMNVTVTVTVDGTDYNVTVTDGKGSLTLSDLPAGEYDVKVRYSGDENHTGSEASSTLTIKKYKAKFSIDSENINVGEDETITVTLPGDATGSVIISVAGKDYNVTVKDGKASLVIPGLKARDYVVTAKYSGDDKYESSTTQTDSFVVEKIRPDVHIESPTIKVGQDGAITVYLPEDATGTVTLVIDGKRYTSPVINGIAVFDIPNLGPGKHKYSVYYSGDDKYSSTEYNGEIDVNSDKKSIHHGGNGIDLSTKVTGNPIFILLILLIALFLAPLRRFKKD